MSSALRFSHLTFTHPPLLQIIYQVATHHEHPELPASAPQQLRVSLFCAMAVHCAGVVRGRGWQTVMQLPAPNALGILGHISTGSWMLAILHNACVRVTAC